MRLIFSILFITISFALPAAAQSKVELQRHFEGKQITFRIDMPAADGVDVYPERSQALNYDEYNEQLRKGGVSIARGTKAIISQVKVQDKSIEVVFEEQTGTQAHFNLHYARLESWMLSPTTVVDALNRYVEFSAIDKEAARSLESSGFASGYVRKGVVHVGPRTTYLKLGLTTEEVVKLLGEPSLISQRSENGKTSVTYQFDRGKGRILIAEFVEDSLVGSELRPVDTVAMVTGS